MALDIPYESDESMPPEDCGCNRDGCVKNGYHYAEISVPLELKPNASLGDITVECRGDPDIVCCESSGGTASMLTVTQKVSVNIPIYYQVSACMGESTISCDSDTPCCR